jgi:hypothetical protein
VWAEFQKQQAVEREQLRRLLAEYRELLQTNSPDPVQLYALAGILHSFYTGVENIFKRAAQAFGSSPPQGQSWHRDLLDGMAVPVASRPAVISASLRDRLDDYLTFRHRFRNLYGFELEYERMAELVLGCASTLGQLEVELDAFLAATQPAALET